MRCQRLDSTNRSTTLGTKTEIKSMNSFRVGAGLQPNRRSTRQIELLESGGRVVQETRGWDEGAGRDASQAFKKEESARLPVLSGSGSGPAGISRPPGSMMSALRELPLPPFKRYVRYVDEYGLPTKNGRELVETSAGKLASMVPYARGGQAEEATRTTSRRSPREEQNEDGLSEPVATFSDSGFVRIRQVDREWNDYVKGCQGDVSASLER